LHRSGRKEQWHVVVVVVVVDDDGGGIGAS
jgi:hypothetical protein